jgi:hypothetical protein
MINYFRRFINGTIWCRTTKLKSILIILDYKKFVILIALQLL